MNAEIADYIDVRQRMRDLGCLDPSGIVLLPANFDAATARSELKQLSEAATVRTLFRNKGLPVADVLPPDERLPSIQNNNYEWISPTLFVTTAVISQQPECVAVALSVLANYVTEFFMGLEGQKTIKLEIVVEKTSAKICKKLSYEGDVAGLSKLSEIVQEIANE